MYSWDEDTSKWTGPGRYVYSPAAAPLRADAAAKERAYGERTYEKKNQPKGKIVDPHKRVRSDSANPLIVAIDVTGSMANWPFEIFDRLPLLYNTLSQYRPDLQICFAAIGDAAVDEWPLQVTTFANGFDLEQLLGAIYGEGGGGDAPESYGLFAHWVNTHVEVPNAAEPPFLIVFGDAPMHAEVPAAQVQAYLGDQTQGSVNSTAAWQQVARKWNTWFLRRPTGSRGDEVDKQWALAVGEQKIFRIQNEQRAVDYAMGLIARAWGYFGDFQDNMRSRQDEDQVSTLKKLIELICPRCGAPLSATAGPTLTCRYCGTSLKL